MRLISQNGMIDVPYEKSIIEYEACERNGEDVFHIIFARTTRNTFPIARYSTESKALKVMEMLREQYMKLGMIKILASGTCEYMDKSLEKEEKMDIYTDYCRKHCFKFPADEEVEV